MKLTKEQLDEAIKNKRCPYCKHPDKRFYTISGKAKVRCSKCDRLMLPLEAWRHWFWGDTEEQANKKIKEKEEKYKRLKERKEEMEGEVADNFGMERTSDGEEYFTEYVKIIKELKEG